MVRQSYRDQVTKNSKKFNDVAFSFELFMNSADQVWNCVLGICLAMHSHLWSLDRDDDYLALIFFKE